MVLGVEVGFVVFDDAGFKLSLVGAFDHSGDFFDHSNFFQNQGKTPIFERSRHTLPTSRNQDQGETF